MPTPRIRPARPARPPIPALPALPSFAALDETHRQILQILDDLERLPGLMTQPGGSAEAAAVAERACTFFGGAARQHHEDEETAVFPSLLEGADAELRGYVQRLQQDHHWFEEDWLELEPHLQAVAKGLGDVRGTFLRDALAEFAALQREHVALEELLIYPEAKRRQAASGTPA